MKTVIWGVRVSSAPTVDRYCKRCGIRAEFASSGFFRVNAQQKSLDVWLIYRCVSCDTTWNLTVLSRVAPQSIPPDQLRGFYENDPDLALRYATDATLIKRNGAQPGQPEIEVIGTDATPREAVRIHLISEQPVDIKVETVLRRRLSLTRNEFDELLSSGKLLSLSGHDLKRCKLSGEIILELR